MRLQVITLVGPVDDGQEQSIVAFAARYGFHAVATGDVINGETGATGHQLAHLAQLSKNDVDTLEEIGFKEVEQIARLTMADAWRQIGSQLLAKVALYMDAHKIAFADGPATDLAEGYRLGSSNKLSLFPELPGLDARIKTPLWIAGVMCVRLVEGLTDAELASFHNMNRGLIAKLRAAIGAYRAAQQPS